jgi:hypothetical protein
LFKSDLGIQKVELEMDCLTLKMALSSTAYDDSAGGNLFRELNHCPRACNMVAHRLASIGANLSDGSMILWHDVVPASVIPLVAADSIPVSS